ncbi:MAG TPA: hypothetical protein VJH37_03750 [Candidatus Nanoarchaeia archaeon]|nr:hypothetical protein [Candidatus Nanoarchaeia archaeon]
MAHELFTKETAKEYGRRGGKAGTRAQNLARALNGMAKSKSSLAALCRLAKTTDVQEAYEYYMLLYCLQEELIESEKNPKKKFYMNDRYIQRLLDFHKIKFGNKNLNLNADINLDVIRERIAKADVELNEIFTNEQVEELGETAAMKKFDEDLSWSREFYAKKREKELTMKKDNYQPPI